MGSLFAVFKVPGYWMVKRVVEVGFISELIVGEMSKIWTAVLESEKPEKRSGDGYG